MLCVSGQGGWGAGQPREGGLRRGAHPAPAAAPAGRPATWLAASAAARPVQGGGQGARMRVSHAGAGELREAEGAALPYALRRKGASCAGWEGQIGNGFKLRRQVVHSGAKRADGAVPGFV